MANQRLTGCVVSLSSPYRWLIAATGVAVSLLLSVPPAAAQSPGMIGVDDGMGEYRPQRLIHLFDFEERDEGNFEDLPMHWYIVGRPPQTGDPNFARYPLHQQQLNRAGFPRYTTVRFDTEHAVSGKHSLLLRMNGGSVGSFLEVGSVPAVPDSDYLISAWVKTDGLQRSRARLTVYFMDSDGQRIPGSERTTGPIVTMGQWRRVALRLLGDFPDAAWVGMQTELLQPDGSELPPLAGHGVVLEDVTGDARFDDIAVWQLPRMRVETQSPVNILRGEQPTFTLQVRDLTGQALSARATLYDLEQQIIARDRYRIGAGAPSTWNWTPRLPKHGWYLLDLVVFEEQAKPGVAAKPVARTLGAVLYLPAYSVMQGEDAPRFTVFADGIGDRELKRLGQVLSKTGLRSTVISAWTRDTDTGNIEDRQEMIDGLLQPMLAQGVHVGLSLSPLPRLLARAGDTDPDVPLPLLAMPRDEWLNYIAPVTMRHGQQVKRLVLGTPDRPEPFFYDDLPQVTRTAVQQLNELMPDPAVALPWSIHQEHRPLTSPVPLGYVLDVPPTLQPDYLKAHLESWLEDDAGRVTLRFRPKDAREYNHPSRVGHLARSMLNAWDAGVDELAISRPWTRLALRDSVMMPDPIMGPFTTLAHKLSGREVVGRLNLAKGIECLIFDGPAGGMLAVWNQAAAEDNATFHMLLGDRPTACDLWGNQRPLPLIDGKHRFTATRMPLLIEHIDPRLALLRASFEIDPSFIRSTQETHERVIRLTNPWPRTISGSLQIIGPEEWTIQPRRRQFSIAAGDTAEFPVALRFPISELAGDKTLRVRADFVAEKRYVIDMATPMEVGLDDVMFDATLAIDGKDAVVTQIITNTGEQEVALYAFAQVPGYRRLEKIIARLEPGQSIVRRFRFMDAGADAIERRVRVGLRETQGPAVLNRILELES